MGAKVLICGITFKENCPDIRNSRVLDIINELNEFGLDINVWDPTAYPEEVKHEYNIDLIEKPASGFYDAIVLAVSHREFITLGKDGLEKFTKTDGIFYDIKEVLSKKETVIYKR
jgi:UDP-N-acetyl-D-galactosamine dehydrogenase